MKKRIVKTLIAAAAVVALTLPGAVMARGPGGGGGQGTHAGQVMGTQSRSMEQTRNMEQMKTQQRLHDGTGLHNPGAAAGSLNRGGKTYGPGDGTGNMGAGPKDGTGYGAPGAR